MLLGDSRNRYIVNNKYCVRKAFGIVMVKNWSDKECGRFMIPPILFLWYQIIRGGPLMVLNVGCGMIDG